jgi:hypothetical protein
MRTIDVSIAIILASALGAAGWDAWLAVRNELDDGGDYCDGFRAINKYTGGLFALALLALWIHVFVLPITGW